MSYSTVYIVIMPNNKVHKTCWNDLAEAQRYVEEWDGTIQKLQLEDHGDS